MNHEPFTGRRLPTASTVSNALHRTKYHTCRGLIDAVDPNLKIPAHLDMALPLKYTAVTVQPFLRAMLEHVPYANLEYVCDEIINASPYGAQGLQEQAAVWYHCLIVPSECRLLSFEREYLSCCNFD